MTHRTYWDYGIRPSEFPQGALVAGTFDLSKPLPPPPADNGAAPPVDVPANASEPFVGITTDGTTVDGLYSIADEGFSAVKAVHLADDFLASLTDAESAAARRPVDSSDWRLWTNAFPSWPAPGVSLDLVSEKSRDLALRVVEHCMSAEGYRTVRNVMRLNAYLGDIYPYLPDTLKEFVYFFTIYGEPSNSEPWGWQLFGHHVSLNCFVLGPQLVMTPMFLGAEPCIVEENSGDYAGLTALLRERKQALEFRRTLTPEQERSAVLYWSINSDDLPPELAGFADGRHLGASGSDNRVIPYEGLKVSQLSTVQQNTLMDLVAVYLARMPEGHAQARLLQIREHLDETSFCWMGGSDDDSPFYCRVHSPVVLIEYDNHQGIFIANDEPEPFHAHTVIRTPNGGDYGHEVLRQYRGVAHG